MRVHVALQFSDWLFIRRGGVATVPSRTSFAVSLGSVAKVGLEVGFFKLLFYRQGVYVLELGVWLVILFAKFHLR